MKFAKLLVALAGTLLLLAVLVLPQVIEAKRARAALAASMVPQGNSNVVVGHSTHNDTSPALRDMKQLPLTFKPQREANENPRVNHSHKNVNDEALQTAPITAAMPGTDLNFDGVPYPGVACNCAPPDTNGEVGATQYVQIVNEGYAVWDKTTGAQVLAPVGISTIWNGFGGVCQGNGDGDPVVLYDQLANRWLVSQFAGASVPTDECIAISTTSDATGSYYRYDFHLGSNFFDYPHLSVWPDGYYMSMNVFDSTGTFFLGAEPFVFDRSKMLAGLPGTFITRAALGGNSDAMLPADLDGSTPPPAGAPATFVAFPSGFAYTTFHYHVDWGTTAHQTWTTVAARDRKG